MGGGAQRSRRSLSHFLFLRGCLIIPGNHHWRAKGAQRCTSGSYGPNGAGKGEICVGLCGEGVSREMENQVEES